MFDRLEISVLPPGSRFAAQLRFWVNGEDVVEGAVDKGGRGPFAADVLPADRLSPLRATSAARRVELGEPECTGGCCGFLSVVVQRFGDIVQWSDWEVPYAPTAPPPEFCFDASQYDAELARAEADRWWQVYTWPSTPRTRTSPTWTTAGTRAVPSDRLRSPPRPPAPLRGPAGGTPPGGSAPRTRSAGRAPRPLGLVGGRSDGSAVPSPAT